MLFQTHPVSLLKSHTVLNDMRVSKTISLNDHFCFYEYVNELNPAVWWTRSNMCLCTQQSFLLFFFRMIPSLVLFSGKGNFINPLLHCTCVSEKYSGTHTIKNLSLQILELRVDVEFLKREIKCVNHCCDSVLKPRLFVFWIITALICLTFSKREIRSSSITDSASVSISQGKVRLL